MLKKKVALVLSIIMVLGMTLQANAAGTLYNCQIWISCKSNGVGIEFETHATEEADEIGCKNIVLEENVNGSWRTININGGYETNDRYYGSGAVYTGAVKGRSYRASCTHYAVFAGTTVTLSTSTGTMVYN